MRNHLWCPKDPRGQGIDDDYGDDDDDGGGDDNDGGDDDDDNDDDVYCLYFMIQWMHLYSRNYWFHLLFLLFLCVRLK